MADMHKVDRKAQYSALREAGFSREIANSLKGASPAKVAEAIASKTRPEINIAKITQGPKAKPTSKGYKPKPEPKPREHKARGIEYRPISEHEKQYLDKYSFVVSYRYKKSDEKHFITITAHQNMYGYEVLNEARETLQTNSAGKYNPNAIAWSSLKIEYAVYNPEGM